MSELSHRDRCLGELRRLFERCETKGMSAEAMRPALREQYLADAVTLKDAIHFLGADAHLEKAKAVQRTADPTANALIQAMLPQLLIVFARRLGGDVLVPVDELDATGAFNLGMATGPGVFRFTIARKA